MPTFLILTHDHANLCPGENILHHVLEWGFLDLLIDLVEEVVEVLICVLLNTGFNRLIIPVLERVAVLLGVVVLSISEFETAEELLCLVEHVIIHFSYHRSIDYVWLFIIICHQHHIPEHFCVIELLVHGVHIANTS